MEKLQIILKRKPLLFLIGSLFYVIIVYLFKWNIHPSWNALWFMSGSIIGLYLLEAAEDFFHLEPSPFRSIVFVTLLTIVSFFVVTSSGSYLASGVVLMLCLTLFFLQLGEWVTVKNLHRWYTMLADPIPTKVQFGLLIIFGVCFFIETVLFIRM